MPELVGIITTIKKFMSNSDEDIFFSFEGKKKVVLSLSKERIYKIPDFQREIRWTCDNIAMLIEDIKTKPRFLGNIILTQNYKNEFFIIDGQQRITILTMILNSLKQKYKGEIDIIEPCELIIESFSEFGNVLNNGFDAEYCNKKEIKESDKLKQLSNYKKLWEFIWSTKEISNKRQAKNFIENLEESTFNLIINQSESIGDGIRYFMDVNLKGKQLDTEDIFKSYLFKNDGEEEIRKQWYLLKSNSAEIESSKMEYPLLKLLEHYLLCDLYQNENYNGMEFGTDFLLKKMYEEENNVYRTGTHLIEVINNNQYMRKSLAKLNQIIQLMLTIVKSESLTDGIKEIFSASDKSLDHTELKVIHNIIGKILKDSKILPKALLIKYFSILLNGKEGKKKINIQKIYGIYLFTVLFSLFENKKSTDVLMHIIKADEDKWYKELVDQINNYFSPDAITDARLLAQYKLGRNEDEENHKFRCKSLATIYNFFVNKDGRVSIRKGAMNDLHKFIIDDDSYSIEHFIISEAKEKTMLLDDGRAYKIEPSIYNRYVNNYFNFIFISREMNSKLKNYWLPYKYNIIKEQPEEVSCEFSKMIIEVVEVLKNEIERKGNKKEYKKELDHFLAIEFKELYIEYTRSALKRVIDRIKIYDEKVNEKK